MPEPLAAFLYMVGLQMPFLIVGLLLVRLVALPLKTFMGVYLLLVTGNVALTYFMLPEVPFWIPLVTAAAGAVLLVVATGALGTKFQASSYETILVAVGLFPWYLGPGVWFTYIAVAGVTLAVWTSISVRRGFRKVGHKKVSIERAKKELSPEEFQIFARTASIVFAIPVLIGAVASAAVAAL